MSRKNKIVKVEKREAHVRKIQAVFEEADGKRGRTNRKGSSFK